MSEELERPEAPAAKESSRDTMARVFEESQAQGDPGDENDAVAPVATDLENETPEERADRVRDEKGRFAKKQSEPETALENTGDIPTGQSDDRQQAAPVSAPLSIPGELRKVWGKLPREWQEYYAKRDLEHRQAISSQGTQLEELNEVVKNYAPDWEARGFTAAQVLRQHIGWSKQLEADPVGALFRLGSMYGVGPQHFAQALQQNGQGQQAYVPQQQVDPRFAHLEQRLQTFEQQAAEQQEAYHEQIVGAAQQETDSFFAEADTQGNLLRPYFNEVFGPLVEFTRAMRANNPTMPHRELLDRAYAAAIAATPEIRVKVEQDRERARTVRERQTVDQARRMGSSVRGAPNGAAGAPKRFGSVAETMRAAYEGKIQ